MSALIPNAANDNAVAPVSPLDARVAVSFSRGILAIDNLAAILGVEKVVSPREARRQGLLPEVMLVWGRKENTQAAIDYAEHRGLPVWYLEDGWIRSADENAHSRRLYSLLVDPLGVYYDASAPSMIEATLNLDDEGFAEACSPADRERAAAWRRALVAAEITKYNYCRTPGSDALDDERALVLVVDQTRDDASVRLGGMNERRFAAMLDAAIEENPRARIVVRSHPDVVAGRREGYLDRLAADRGIELLAGDDNPLPWLKRAERVYVGTSQLGYEALLCDTPVTVFGQPFYAGWGLADERQTMPRRQQRRSIDELFHVCHVMLARYASPMSGKRWTLGQMIDHVALQKSMFRRNARDFHCVGITPWKRGYVRRFLRSPDGSVTFGRESDAAPGSTLLTWGFRRYANSSAETKSVWRMEDGFLRSAGLGSDFAAPGSLVIDGAGLYFDPGSASDLEVLLNHHNCSEAEIERARALRELVLESRVSKYNLGNNVQKVEKPVDKLCVLVTGQVEDDESVKRGSQVVSSNTELLQTVRKARPDAWIVYRPHPDVQAGNRRGRVDPFTEQSCADEVDVDSAIADCIDRSDEVHTMTSLSGFEALLREKQVVTHGAPFYAGWGLTEDHVTIERRSRQRTLDELVFITLILYPRYLDVASGEFIEPEQMVGSILRQKEQGMQMTDANWPGRQFSKVVNMVRGLRYAP
ncbi:MAG: beta-3-deoxy-D-manno-oct-2-ulosonic acid transferase [Gammaproteobacteria bacterium]|nr:MAG: beta-3-deoxy-D-manno-oct-2-ulosonic acid transferase [Gammaproteobacteria bacterium]PIE36434.1 MAG: beta-3-deoxy-D-manno-oct-2-ulosonic acid transferase [Gammaproteobacteria bacterium]